MKRILTTGTIMIDILAVDLDKIADPGEVVWLKRPVEIRVGGHPLNVAIDLVKLGIPSSLVAVTAAVGEGPEMIFGQFVTNSIKRYGITAFLQGVLDKDTGTNSILVVKSEDRRFHMDPGANLLLRTDHVKRSLTKWKPDIFCVRPGYSGIDLRLKEVLAPLVDTDTLVFLDIMQPHSDRPKHFLKPIFQFADMIHCNEGEALVNTGASTLEEAITEFLHAGVKVVFMTRGAEGARIITPKYDIWQSGFKVDAIDPTGCGDGSCAGFVYTLMQRERISRLEELSEKELVDILLMAQAVGATVATAPGCTEGVSREKVDELLDSQGDDILDRTKISSTNL